MIFKNMLKKRQDGRAALVQRFRVMLAERLPGVAMTPTGDMEFRLDGPGLKESTIFLENLFRQVDGMESSESDAMIERYFAALTERVQEVEDPLSRDAVVPMIKDQLYLDMIKDKNLPLVMDHFVADLWIIYALDSATMIHTLKLEQVEALAIPRDSLREVAIGNLLRIIPTIERHGDGEWFLVTAGEYTASVLLFDSIWQQLADTVEGDLVAAAPARDVLLVTGTKSPGGIAAVRAKAQEIEQGGSYAISQTLLRRVDNRWTVLGLT